MEPQEIKSIQSLCDILIKSLSVDEWDLDQIQKRLFKMGFNGNSQYNQLYQIMYYKFNEMKANKEMPKTETKYNNDSESESDSEDDSEDEEPQLEEPIETEEEKINKTLRFYKYLKEANKKVDWKTDQYKKNYETLRKLENNDLNIQMEANINNKKYKVCYSFHNHSKRMGIIVGETNNFYKIQSIERKFKGFDEQQTSHYIYELPTEIKGETYKVSKDKIYKFMIYEDLTDYQMID
jgi:hypothetical protein